MRSAEAFRESEERKKDNVEPQVLAERFDVATPADKDRDASVSQITDPRDREGEGGRRERRRKEEDTPQSSKQNKNRRGERDGLRIS